MAGEPKFLREKRFSDRDVFCNFEQDFDKNVFDELKSTACLQQNCKHVFDELGGESIENIINIKKYSSTRKLYRIISWVNRFVKNLKEKLLNNTVLLKPFVTIEELAYRKSGTRDLGPRTLGEIGTRDPISGTRDPNMLKWDPEPGTPEVGH